MIRACVDVVAEMVSQLRGGARRLLVGITSPGRDSLDVGDAASGFLYAATKPLLDHDGTVTVDLRDRNRGRRA
jgi:hypothetical protein